MGKRDSFAMHLMRDIFIKLAILACCSRSSVRATPKVSPLRCPNHMLFYLETLFAVCTAAIGAAVLLLGAAMPSPMDCVSIWTFTSMLAQTPAAAQQVMNMALLDDSRLRLICIAGTLAGSVVSVFLMPPKVNIEKPTAAVVAMALRITASGLAGILFAPAVIRYFKIPLDTDWVLSASGAVAIVALGILKLIVPLVMAVAVPIFKKVVGKIPGMEGVDTTAFGPSGTKDSAGKPE